MIVQVGQSGLNTDVATSKLPPDAVTGGQNFLCTEGSVRAPTMRLKAFDLTIEPVYHFIWTNADNEEKLVISDGEKVLLYDADGTEHDINSSNRFTAGSQVTMTDLGTVLVVNSNQDGPFYYNPDTDALVALPGWTSTWRCEVMASVRYNLVALNMTEDGDAFPQKLRWSSSAEDGAVPNVWVPALTNDAGDDILGETGGHIIGAANFRDSLWIGKTDGIYEMRYLGGQFVYSITRRTGDLGISSHRGIVAAKNALYVVSRDDIYAFDGSTAKSQTDNRIHNLLLDLSSNGSYEYAELDYSPNQDFLFVTLAGTGRAADKILIQSFADNTWNVVTFGDVYGFGMMALTADTDPELVCIRSEQGNYQIERFTGIYDAELEGDYLFVIGDAERTGIPLENVMMVQKVLPILRGSPLDISIGVQASQDAEIRWTPPYTIIPGGKKFIPVRKAGRFVCWKAYARARQPWYLDALDFRVVPMGDND